MAGGTAPRTSIPPRFVISRWAHSPWGLIDHKRRQLGSWIFIRRGGPSGGDHCGVGCKVCRKYSKAKHCCPPGVGQYVAGNVTGPSAQRGHLHRHSQTNFHKLAVTFALGLETGSNGCALAPPVAHFHKVLDHVVLHGGSAHAGLAEVGHAKKLRRMVVCLAEACKRHDMLFSKTSSPSRSPGTRGRPSS